MLNTLALFSLLTIGWAEFQCDSPDSANGPYCRNPANSGGPFLIGKCKSPDDTCVTADQCTVEGAPCGKDDKALLKGTCVIKTKTCFPNDAIAAGKCAPDAAANTYCKNGDLVGQCNGIPSDNKCVTAGKCSVDGAACGHSTDTALKGICVKNGTCYGKTIAAGKCAPLNAAGAYCKNGDLVGQCDGNSSDNTCVTAGKCSVDGAACGHSTDTALKGICVKDGTCYAGTIAAGKCAPLNAAAVYCKHGNLVGKCDGVQSDNKCVTAGECSAKADGEDCGHSTDTTLKGQCIPDDTCYSTVGLAYGECVMGTTATSVCKKGMLVGLCDGQSATNDCRTDEPCKNATENATCTDLPAGFKGYCDATSNCVSSVTCTTEDAPCKNGKLAGKCSSSANGVCLNDKCTVDGAKCGETYPEALQGKCVAMNGTCFLNSEIGTGKCAPGTSGLTFCKNTTFVGMCDGQDATNNCVIDAQCHVDGRDCGHKTDATLMGKCVAGVPPQMGKCYSTADITVGECAPGTKKDTYCTHKKSSTVTHVGKCKGGGTNTCETVAMCTAAGSYCGHSADYALKGQCIKTGFCFSTVGLGGQCVPGTESTTSCMKDMFLGVCAGGGSANECNTTSPCAASPDYTTCKSGLQGWCESEKCVPTVSCENTQTYCKNDALIGMCNGTSGDANRVCITAPGHAKLCETKETEDACGNSDVASGFTGYCEATKGECKMGKAVNIQYKIQLKPEALDTKSEREAFATKLEGSDFNSYLMGKLSRSVGDNEIPDCTKQGAVANGTFPSSCSGTSHEKGSDTCALTCTAPAYSLKRAHTRKCSALGQWIGVEGMCGKRCDATGGTVLADKTTLRFESSTPEEGTLDCMAPAGFQKVADDSYCNLSCPTGYRVRYPSTKMCDTSTKWTGTRGSCELSTDVLVSATLVLGDDQDHANIIQEKDEMFNNKFKASVAALLQGVSAENVIIVDIKNVQNAGSRRLNEKAVLVNYSIREGATELDSPEDDGHLALGGALRGIR